VERSDSSSKWIAFVDLPVKRRHVIGCYDYKEMAAFQYNALAKCLKGAKLNEVDDTQVPSNRLLKNNGINEKKSTVSTIPTQSSEMYWMRVYTFTSPLFLHNWPYEWQLFGVNWNESINKWVVQLAINGALVMKYYDDEVDAGKKYDALVRTFSNILT